MATFPDIQQPSNISETRTKSQIKSEFGNGDVISRPRYSRARSKYTFSWNALPEADYQDLIDFFDENQGLTFTWDFVVGDTTDTKTIRFSEDDMGTWSFAGPGYRSGSISVEEA